ncbi:MAG: ComEC/Rec2 family competence protein, partial [Paracoccaceae bacterium]
AGIATAPVGMAHFNLVSHFGLLANIVSVPLMGVWVIPFGAVAMALIPFGLEAWPLMAMGWGIDWILGVAEAITHWPNARSRVPSPPGWVLPVLAMGGLYVILWQGRGRALGVVPVVLAFGGWMATDRPDMLIAEDGNLVAVRTADGLALSRETGARFVAQVWLENDGTLRAQHQAAALWPDPAPVRLVRGKRAARAYTGCQPQEIVVSNQPLSPAGPCVLFHPPSLTGAVAGYRTSQGWRFVTDTDLSGVRLWSPDARSNSH